VHGGDGVGGLGRCLIDRGYPFHPGIHRECII
jgi:hypothetical protein